MPTTSADAPLAVSMSLNAHNAQGSVCDWVYSRTLERFPDAQARLRREPGRLDAVPVRAHGRRVARDRSGEVDLPEPPSTYVRGRVFGCIFDDLHGLRSRDEIGMEHILFECDFPHSNGSFPDSRRRAWELSSKAGLDRRRCTNWCAATPSTSTACSASGSK